MSNADPTPASSDETATSPQSEPAVPASTPGVPHTVSPEVKRRNRITALIILAGVFVYIGIGMFRSWLSAQ